jgi:hypothetical protein
MSAMNIPGVSDIYDSVKSYAYQKNQSLEEMTGSTVDYISSQIYSRLIPSILSDVANATDKFTRKSVKGVESIKSKIPGLRQTLPIKKDIFGEDIKGESPTSDILFGSRVKTDKENAIIKEINRVSTENDKGVNFTDWDKSSSKTLVQFKQEVGPKEFEKAKIEYGKALKTRLEEVFSNSDYQDLSNEDKLRVINSLDAEVMKDIFYDYNFEYQSESSTKLPKL